MRKVPIAETSNNKKTKDVDFSRDTRTIESVLFYRVILEAVDHGEVDSGQVVNLKMADDRFPR